MTEDHQINSLNNDTPATNKKPLYSQYPVPLTDIEQKVLGIAKELMRKHYLLDLEDLCMQSVRFLQDYTRFAIQQAIDGLGRKNVLFGGSALTRETVLDNETRRRIFDIIRVRPGIHFSAIRKAVDTDSRTIMIHLRVLERFEMIRTTNYNNSRAYFDFFLYRENDLFFHYSHKDKVREIYAALLSQPGISLGSLASVFRETPFADAV
jgi:DNA-binding transcriptional ArsR family regulator